MGYDMRNGYEKTLNSLTLNGTCAFCKNSYKLPTH